MLCLFSHCWNAAPLRSNGWQARQALQDQLLRNVLGAATVKDEPWIVFTAGAMGAGKGYVVDQLVAAGRFPLAGFVKCYAAAEPLDRYRGLALPARASASHCIRCSDLQAPRLPLKFRGACVFETAAKYPGV